MSDGLRPDDFAEFVRAVHGYDPFGWQRDLLARVHSQRSWPELIDVPTGGGKTAALDIALFALALDTTTTPDLRWAPRRIVMVVDRRVVVDQTARRAQSIVTALKDPKNAIVAAVSAALSSLSVDGVPAIASTLRGGLVQDVSWAKWPDVPVLISSTVDQVGSRLLFRGYGVSAGMRPVHAGLFGNDTLILLDEVHLSQPFAQTLRAIRDRYQPLGEVPIRGRWQLAELSATPGRSVARSFVVNPSGVSPDGVDAELVRRFRATKPARLRLAAAKRGDARPPIVAAAMDEVVQLLRNDQVRRLGVVVNRVASAHSIAAELRPALADSDDVDVILLTGRIRPFDRDDEVQEITGRLAAGVPRGSAGRRVALVATQCIEAGADLDLDGLVTECASLDALRQRFGRVDRLGELTALGTPATGVIIGQRSDIDPGSDDPVYGGALSATWSWLNSQPDLDFGITGLRLPEDAELAPLLAQRADAPLLRHGDLDRWVQTQPAPRPDPDPSLWLHGLDSAAADVQLVWRADLTEHLIRSAVADPIALEGVLAIVNICPPGAGEAVSVPVGACRRWLARRETLAVADVDGAERSTEEEPQPGDANRPCLRWLGEESEVLESPSSIRPGDVLVVPAEYGGYTRGGWSPQVSAPVTDLSHRVDIEQRRRVTLRLVAVLWPGYPPPPMPPGDEDVDAAAGDVGDATTRIREWLTAGPDDTGPAGRAPMWWTEASTWLLKHRFQVRVERLPEPAYVVIGRRPLPAGPADAETVDSEADTSAFTSVEVGLDEHLIGVGLLAGRLARSCHLPATVADDIELAGRMHDLGKTDPRFQLMLHGGDEVAAALATRPLAKSGIALSDRRTRLMAVQRSGYPRGMRHEISSVDMIQHCQQLEEQASDWDLVLHLVASHHGQARPFAPPIVDPAPILLTHRVDGLDLRGCSGHQLASFDSGIAERFWRMVRRYGWFRLAWFEAILRLADHRRSEQEQREIGADDD
ncbi:MAG: type I-G CRISPR-associated helicase/endonuclease Cas3g [Geodermatophilaceae bacterium]